jgi:DNA repair exonuclease SbcCD nuclease subunit
MITDTHFGIYLNNLDKWLNMMDSTFHNFVIPYLKENVKEGDILVHLGDLFDNRTNLPIIVINKVERILREISNILPIHIMVGNHDLWNKGSNDLNSVRLYGYMDNITVYESTTILEVGGQKLVLMPWIENRLNMIKSIKDNKGDYLLCHSDLNGCKMHLNSVSHRNSDMIDVDEFKSYKKVFSGHIHLVQQNKNHLFIGSLYQMDRNDYGDQKGITILDLSNDIISFVPNTYSPIFRKFKIINEDDVMKLNELKNSKDYIDLSISNNLLVSDRKLRRKLESVLENGGFSSVDYIDDIVTAIDNEISEIDSEHMDLDKLDISIQLDYGDYIKQYIMRQKYDNDKFQSGIVNEFDEVIKIYKENYASNKD